MSADEIIRDLKKLKNFKNIDGMARFGINPEFALGISMPILRQKGKQIGRNHDLALKLWDSRIHEARILSSIIDEPENVTKSQMNSWVKEFNSWDLCDQCCVNLFRKTKFADEFPFVWAEKKSEFVKRAGFVMMAVNSVHNKILSDEDILEYIPLIIKHSTDERNFVKKAVNWSLRQIGKRNLNLNREAIKVCKQLTNEESSSAKWIASDALRELTSDKIISRLKEKT